LSKPFLNLGSLKIFAKSLNSWQIVSKLDWFQVIVLIHLLKNLVSSKIVDGKITPGMCKKKNLYKMQTTRKIAEKKSRKENMFVYVCKNFNVIKDRMIEGY